MRTASELHAELFAHVAMPAEWLIVDLLAHESLGFLLKPSVELIGQPDGSMPHGAGTLHIPMDQTPRALPDNPLCVRSEHVPEYERLIASAFARMGCEASAFRGLRFELPYPPMHSTVMMRCDLPEA